MPIAVATKNVWGRSLLWGVRKRAMARELRDADVVVLQEVQARRVGSQAHELAREMGLEHVLFVSAGRTVFWKEGVGVISRWPVLHWAWERFPPHRNFVDRLALRLVMRVVVQTPVGKLEVYATHMSLHKPARATAARTIAAFVARERERFPADFCVIAGDFNAGPGEPWLRVLQEACGVNDAQPGGRGTFPAYCPLRRLDYVLCSRNVHVCRVDRRRSVGSDHCGLVAHLDFVRV